MNILVDNDVIGAVSGFETSGPGSCSTGGTLLWNNAGIINVGGKQFDPLPDSYLKAAQDLAAGKGASPGDILHDPAFAGTGALRVLYVSGDLFNIQYVSQTNVLGNSDQIALAMNQIVAHPEAHGPITTGGTTTRELFRFRTDDGTVDFYDPDGETGKRFLTRRPLQGGGRLASRFGNRVHPIFKSRRMHTGVDLASKTGTPIYASGDGVVEKAGWVSGYGKKVEIKHVNGFETGYGHMSRIADGMKPGVRVRQGQIIGYVGSTGNSTGPHLHFEIKVNGRFVDPLSVKLPRDKSLSAQYEGNFEQTIAQIRDLMKRDAAPMTVASLN